MNESNVQDVSPLIDWAYRANWKCSKVIHQVIQQKHQWLNCWNLSMSVCTRIGPSNLLYVFLFICLNGEYSLVDLLNTFPTFRTVSIRSACNSLTSLLGSEVFFCHTLRQSSCVWPFIIRCGHSYSYCIDLPKDSCHKTIKLQNTTIIVSVVAIVRLPRRDNDRYKNSIFFFSFGLSFD